MMRQLGLFILMLTILTISPANLSAQDGTTYMRIAKIMVDSTKLEGYKAALKEQMQSALKLEKGVLAYSAVQDKANPSKITILETYASTKAYSSLCWCSSPTKTVLKSLNELNY